ncbi:Homocysteine-binding domain protein [Raphanus sativus]|nr:Homocysteine-binding domain protein [Raphanus sativus]
MDQFAYGLKNEIRFHIQGHSCNCLEELAQQAAQIEHENKEPEPLDPSEEVQQNPRYIPISHEQVLRTKLLQGGGNDAAMKSTAPKVDKTFHVWTRMNLDTIKPMVRLTQLAVPKQRPPLKPPYQLINMWINDKLKAEVYADLLEEEGIDIPAWFSFTSKDGVNVPSGESIIECAEVADSCKKVLSEEEAEEDFVSYVSRSREERASMFGGVFGLLQTPSAVPALDHGNMGSCHGIVIPILYARHYQLSD